MFLTLEEVFGELTQTEGAKEEKTILHQNSKTSTIKHPRYIELPDK